MEPGPHSVKGAITREITRKELRQKRGASKGSGPRRGFAVAALFRGVAGPGSSFAGEGVREPGRRGQEEP